MVGHLKYPKAIHHVSLIKPYVNDILYIYILPLIIRSLEHNEYLMIIGLQMILLL